MHDVATCRVGRPTGLILFTAAVIGAGLGCAATESSRRLEASTVQARATAYDGPRHRLVIGKFENRSPYMRGIFSDGVDRLGMQSEQILKTHLSQSDRFVLMDRANTEEVAREAKIGGRQQNLTGGDLLLTGAVTEFGRKEVGASGSIFGRTRSQVAHCKIQVSVVDVNTSQVLFSEQGAGEFELKSGDVLGFGSAAGYDATLNDKVLNLAAIDVVDKLVAAMERGDWGRPR